MIEFVTEAVPPLGLARYGALFRFPHVRRLVLSGMLARLPMGMIGLALLLLVRENGGSYAAAGAVSGGLLRRDGDRRSDRWPPRRPPRAGTDPLRPGADLPRPAARDRVRARAVGCADGTVGCRRCRRGRPDASGRRVAALALASDVRRRRAACRRLRARGIAAGDHVHRRATARRAADRGRLAGACARRGRAPREASARSRSRSPRPCAPGDRRTTGMRRSWARSRRAASSRWSASPPASASASAAPRWAFPPLPSSTAARSSGASPCRSSRAAASSAGSWSGARVTMPPLRLLRVSAVLLAFGLALPLLGWSLPSMSVLAFLAGLAIAPVVMSAYGLVDAVAARGTCNRGLLVDHDRGLRRLLGRDGARRDPDRRLWHQGVVRSRGCGRVRRRRARRARPGPGRRLRAGPRGRLAVSLRG